MSRIEFLNHETGAMKYQKFFKRRLCCRCWCISVRLNFVHIGCTCALEAVTCRSSHMQNIFTAISHRNYSKEKSVSSMMFTSLVRKPGLLIYMHTWIHCCCEARSVQNWQCRNRIEYQTFKSCKNGRKEELEMEKKKLNNNHLFMHVERRTISRAPPLRMVSVSCQALAVPRIDSRVAS